MLRLFLCAVLIFSSMPVLAADRGQFCVENNLYGVFYAVVNYISIGVTVEKNGRVVFPESGEPRELGWGSTWCRSVNQGEELVIHEASYWGNWNSRKTFSTPLLNAIDVRLEQAGRYDEDYGINLVSRPADTQGIPDSSRWMTDLYTNQSTPINQICMLGTHNAGSYAISLLSAQDPHMDKPIKEIFDKVGAFLSLPLKEVLKWWGNTQTMTVYNQLLSGARYLDIRARKINGKLVTAHGLEGASMASVIADLKRFLDERPGEIVIFHVHDSHGMTQADEEELFALMDANFSGRLAPTSLSPTTAISEFQNHGYQVIFVSGFWSRGFPNWSKWSTLSNPWHDKNQPYSLLDKVAGEIRRRNNRQFHVAQLILTPAESDFKTMLLPGWPKNLRQLVATIRYPSGQFQYINNSALLSGRRANIILQDFPEDGDFYNTCMKENIRQLGL